MGRMDSVGYDWIGWKLWVVPTALSGICDAYSGLKSAIMIFRASGTRTSAGGLPGFRSLRENRGRGCGWVKSGDSINHAPERHFPKKERYIFRLKSAGKIFPCRWHSGKKWYAFIFMG